MNDDWKYDAKREYEKAKKEIKQTEKEKLQLEIACLSQDVGNIIKRLVKAEGVVRLIAETYHLTEATAYFDDTSKQN